jgi:hypothetical protein
MQRIRKHRSAIFFLKTTDAMLVVFQHVFQPLYIPAEFSAHRGNLINDLIKPFFQGHTHTSVFSAQPPQRADNGDDASNCQAFNHNPGRCSRSRLWIRRLLLPQL